MKIIFKQALLDCRDVLVLAMAGLGMAQIGAWLGF